VKHFADPAAALSRLLPSSRLLLATAGAAPDLSILAALKSMPYDAAMADPGPPWWSSTLTGAKCARRWPGCEQGGGALQVSDSCALKHTLATLSLFPWLSLPCLGLPSACLQYTLWLNDTQGERNETEEKNMNLFFRLQGQGELRDDQRGQRAVHPRRWTSSGRRNPALCVPRRREERRGSWWAACRAASWPRTSPPSPTANPSSPSAAARGHSQTPWRRPQQPPLQRIQLREESTVRFPHWGPGGRTYPGGGLPCLHGPCHC